MRKFILVAVAATLAGCGQQAEPDDVAGGLESGLGASGEETISCRDYVVRASAAACLNHIRSSMRESEVRADLPTPASSCDLAGFDSAIAGKAIEYAWQDDIGVAHSSGETIDWSGVESRCEVGARIEVAEICERMPASYGC